MAEKLKIISLGGLNEIGKNLTVYEYGGDIIVVDCGMGFPDDDMYGIDVVIPDVSYLIKNQSKIRGIFITHGHEDHIGALPYVLRSINAPIYATRMSMGLIRLKLEEHRLLSKTKLITCEAGDVVKAGKFSVEFIHVNHSIADAVAFAIKCPVGTCVHTGDFKIDSTPIQGGMMDLARLGELGKEGVLALLADSTNVERSGFTQQRAQRGRLLRRPVPGLPGAHHRHHLRLQRGPHPADHRRGRPLWPKGGRHRPVHGEHHEGVHRAGLYERARRGADGLEPHQDPCPSTRCCIITTGSQGETMSALTRMAFNTHRQVDLRPGDRVIISASAIPGNENAIGNVVNELYRKGGRSDERAATGPPRLRPRLSGGAEDRPRPGQAQVLHPRPRRAAACCRSTPVWPRAWAWTPTTCWSATSAGSSS